MSDTQTPNTPVPANVPPPDDGPRGIGGWLILPILQIGATALLTLIEFGRAIADPEVRAGFSAMTDGTIPEPLRELAYLVVIDLVVGVTAIALSVVCFIMILMLKRTVPVWMTVFYAFTVFAYGFEWYMAVRFPMIDLESGVASAGGMFIGSCLRAAVWISYFWMSKRVKNTFVH